MSTAVTTKMQARPVWARRVRRLTGDELLAPSEEEKHDAIRVLEAGIRFPLSLYAEAELIMRESSEEQVVPATVALREVHSDFLESDWPDDWRLVK